MAGRDATRTIYEMIVFDQPRGSLPSRILDGLVARTVYLPLLAVVLIFIWAITLMVD